MYVDFNNILHLFTRFSSNEKRFFSNVETSLTKFFLLNQSKESVMIAVDGPASISKIPLQLQRRTKTFNASKSFSIRSMLSIPSVYLTPGTLFMRKTEESILKSIKFILNHKSSHSHSITLSGPCSPGEAEDKIMANIHRKVTENPHYSNKQFTIVSSDGDIILQSLAAIPSNIHIVINTSLNGKTQKISFSKKSFIMALKQTFPTFESQKVLNDFLFLSLLSGNDFFPAVSFGTIKTTWASYVEFQRCNSSLKNFLTINNSSVNLNCDNFKEFLTFFLDKNLSIANLRVAAKKVNCTEYLTEVLKTFFQLSNHKYNGKSNCDIEFGGISIFDIYHSLHSDIIYVADENPSCLIKSPSISAIMVI